MLGGIERLIPGGILGRTQRKFSGRFPVKKKTLKSVGIPGRAFIVILELPKMTCSVSAQRN